MAGDGSQVLTETEMSVKEADQSLILDLGNEEHSLPVPSPSQSSEIPPTPQTHTRRNFLGMAIAAVGGALTGGLLAKTALDVNATQHEIDTANEELRNHQATQDAIEDQNPTQKVSRLNEYLPEDKAAMEKINAKNPPATQLPPAAERFKPTVEPDTTLFYKPAVEGQRDLTLDEKVEQQLKAAINQANQNLASK